MQVRRSFVEELDLSASEVEIVLDYFVYGREVFEPEEVAFVEGMYMTSKQISHKYLWFKRLKKDWIPRVS